MAASYTTAPRCTTCARRIRYSRPVMVSGLPYGRTCGRRELALRAVAALAKPAKPELRGEIIGIDQSPPDYTSGLPWLLVREDNTGRELRVYVSGSAYLDAQLGGRLTCTYRNASDDPAAPGTLRVWRASRIQVRQADGGLGVHTAAGI